MDDDDITDRVRIREMAQRIADLENELQAAKLDAARYHWLKQQAAITLNGIAYRVKAACRYEDTDKAIDTAMKSRKYGLKNTP